LPAALRGRHLRFAAQKKARDKARGQCVTVLITERTKVIGADGALIGRRRQSGGLALG
jgi:hypothetical protein